MASIEQLRTRIENTTQEIEDSKELSSEQKLKKAREIETKILQIKSELDALKSNTESSDKETEKNQDMVYLESEYITLNENFQNNFKTELDALRVEVETPVQDQDLETLDGSQPKSPEKEKSRLGKQFEGITSGDERKNNTGKNILRVAGGVGVVRAGSKLIGWMFGGGKKNKEKSEGEKNGFWNSGLGKVVKRGGIGIGAFLGIRRLLDYFKKGEVTDEDKEQYNDYLDFMEENPEDYQQYEQLGGEVNNMYDVARDTEINNFGFESFTDMGSIGDNLEKREGYEHVSTKGMVPFCFDNYYTNVDEMLSAGGYRSYVRKKTFTGYEQDIKKRSGDQINRFLVPFLSTFASWSTLGIVSSDSAQDKMTKFFDATESTEERKQQLDMFFRQYGKMMTYMADKNNALKMKCAEPILKVNGYDGDSWPSDPEEQQEMLLEATDDKEWLESNLSGTAYQTFRDSKILGASKVLEAEGLLNSDITFELKGIIYELDSESSDILGGLESNALLDAQANLSEGKAIDQSTKQGLGNICDNLIEDMGDEQNGGWFYDNFDYLSVALDLEDAQKEELLENSGMGESMTSLRSEINKLKADVTTNPTSENIEKLNELTGEYLALKKEFELMMYAISQAKENKDAQDYAVQTFNGIVAFISHTFSSLFKVLKGDGSGLDYVYFFLGLAITGTALKITGRAVGGVPGKVMVYTGDFLKKTGGAPITLRKYGRRQLGYSRAIKNRIIDLAKDGNHDKANRLLNKAISEGKLTDSDAVNAAKHNEALKSVVNNGSKSKNFEELMKKVAGLDDSEAILISKYYKKNRKVTSGLLNYSQTWSLSDKAYDFDIKKNQIGFDKLSELDAKVKNFTGNSEKYINKVFKRARNLDDISNLTKIAGDQKILQAIDKMSPKQLNKFSKLSFKEIDKLKTAGKLDSGFEEMMTFLGKNKKVVKQASDIVESVVELDTKFQKMLDDEIKLLNKSSSSPSPFVDQDIKSLKKLKKLKSASDGDDIKILYRLHESGISARHFPRIAQRIGSDEIGPSLKQSLGKGNIEEFLSIVKTNEETLGGAPKFLDDINAKGAGKILGNLGDEGANLVKGFVKVLARIT